MKLDRITAENLLGIQRVDIPLPTPVVVIAGANGNGKTSIIDAVVLAMTGQPARSVNLKKDYLQMVHNAKGIGTATVLAEGGEEFCMVLPKGKGHHSEHHALPFVLDPGLLVHMKPADRKSALFNLLGLDLTAKAVKPRMAAMGLDMAKAERVLPMLRVGFEDAAKVAAEAATQSKGAWKQVTGEQWGSDKGAAWKAQRPAAVSGDAVQSSKTRCTDLESTLASAQQMVGVCRANLQSAQSDVNRRTQLAEKAEQIERLQKKLATDEQSLAEWDADLAKTRNQAGVAPRVGLLHDLAASVADLLPFAPGDSAAKADAVASLQAYEIEHGKVNASGGDEKARARLPNVQASRDLMARSVENARRDLNAALAAKAELDAMTPVDIASLSAELSEHEASAAKLAADLRQAREALDALMVAQRAADSADASTLRAAELHNEIMAWLAVAEALGPAGIPGQMVAEGMAPLTSRLAQSAEDTGWPVVAVDPTDATITYGCRPYQLLSKSEQWRTQAMLAEAISHVSGLKLLALDGLDVLGSVERGQAITWFDTLAINAEIDTLLVTATLKSAQAQWPASFSAFWVHDGICEQQAATAGAAQSELIAA